MAQEEKNSLLDFDWDNEDTDFFGVSNVSGEAVKEEVEEKPEPEKVKEVVEEPEDKGEEEKEEGQEEETSFFEEEDSKEEPEKGEEDQPAAETSGNYWEDVYKDFKEQGLLKHVDIEEGEELNAERIFELQQEDYEAEMNARLVHWAKEELDPDAQAFITFKRNGGSTEEFFKTYSSRTEVPKGDLKEESYQDNVIRYQLRQEGWDNDEIEDRIKYLTDNGKKEQFAKKYDKRIQEDVEANKQELLRRTEQQKEALAQQERQFKDTIKDALEETKEVKGFKITDKDKTELYNFLTKKNHKVSDTKSVTGFQKKLSETFQDTSKMLLLAKLINSDFDLSHFEKQAVTKKTKEIKSNLEQRKNLRPGKSGSSTQGTSLADLF